MSNGHDIDEFIKDPSLLIELCREVIDEIVENSSDAETEEKEAQLREISRSIERLEKAKVAIPDALRAEKTRLAAAIGDQSDTYQVLSQLADGLRGIVKELKWRLDRSAAQGRSRGSPSPRGGRTNYDVTLLDLLQSGHLSIEDKLELQWLKDGPIYEGKAQQDGSLMAKTSSGWKQYSSLSKAASEIAESSLNGWKHWRPY
jgi:hypothetical protein